MTDKPTESEKDHGDVGSDGRPRFTLEVASQNVSEAMGNLRDNVSYWAKRGRYNKVRVKRAGKAVLPDIPVGALVAFEAATFFGAGLLRAAIVNVVGRAFFEVELINEAEEHYKKGLEHFLAGDLTEAEDLFRKSLDVDSRFVKAHLQMGVLSKMRGKRNDAQEHFDAVIKNDPHSDAAKEAVLHLKKLAAK
jgi:tetratricopeptide (TPR) repeat protein